MTAKRSMTRSPLCSGHPPPISASTSTPGESDRTPTLRALSPSTSWAPSGPTPRCRAEAARRFDASPIGGGSGDAIPPDIESATLAVVAQLLRPGDYERALLERYRTAATPQEEMRSLRALSAFPDVASAPARASTWP